MIPATVSLDDAGRTPWDVVVVGAGPAGALAAREVARQGQRVLLADRSEFPRHKVCGCCLNVRSLATLAGVGLGGLVSGRGGVPLTEVRWAADGISTAIALPGGVALSREKLDAALIEEAVGAGAAFLPRTTATLGVVRAGRRWLRLEQRGREVEVGSALVLAADGLGGRLLSVEPGFRWQHTPASRIGTGTVSPTTPNYYTPGVIWMACGRNGYVGLTRLEDGRLDVAAAFDPRVGRPADICNALIGEVGWPPIAGLADLPWRGTPPLTRRAVRAAAERVLLLGDAAGYVEPFTGEGIAWALAAAAAIAPLAGEAVSAWSPSVADQWEHVYRQTVRNRQSLCRVVARMLRSPGLTRLAIWACRLWPALAAPLVRHLNSVPPAVGVGLS